MVRDACMYIYMYVRVFVLCVMCVRARVCVCACACGVISVSVFVYLCLRPCCRVLMRRVLCVVCKSVRDVRSGRGMACCHVRGVA